MVYFEHWEANSPYQRCDSTQDNIDADFSGNFAKLSDVLKERLVLDRKSQRLFKTVLRRCASINPSQQFEEPYKTNYEVHKVEKLRERFYLETLVVRKQSTKRKTIDNYLNDIWKLDEKEKKKELPQLSDFFSSENVLREKIKLDDGCKEIFKTLQRKVSLNQLEQFVQVKSNSVENNKLESFLIADIAKQETRICRNRKKKTRFTPFTCKIREEFINLLDESLDRNVCFPWVPQLKSQITVHVSKSFRRFLINDIVKGKMSLARNSVPIKDGKNMGDNSSDTEFWSPTPIDDDRICTMFLMLENTIFDSEFHKLELYKLPVKDSKPSKGPRNIRGRRVCGRVVWKLDKEQLKIMNWNPFKGISQFSCKTNFPWNEEIKQEFVKIKIKEPQFSILRCGDLDLIDATTKNFGNFKVGMNANFADRTVQCTAGAPTDVTTTKASCIVDKGTAYETSPACCSETFSRGTINMSLIPQKRSFIDDELLSIAEMKRSQIKGIKESQGQSNNSSIRRSLEEEEKEEEVVYQPAIDNLTLLKLNSGFYNIPPPPSFKGIDEVHEGGNVTKNIDNTGLKDDAKIGEELLTTCNYETNGKTIILNAAKLEENYSLLKTLMCDGAKMNVLERDLGPYIPCDYIINFSTCLIRLKLSLFQQLSKGGKLHYEETIVQLLKSFQRVIILIEYNTIYEDVDPDIFWKLHLFLAYDSIDLQFVSGEASLAVWVRHYTSLFGSEIDEMELESETIPTHDRELLQAMGFNPFLVQKLLTDQTLPNILQMAQSFTIECLTPYQQHLLSQLTESNW